VALYHLCQEAFLSGLLSIRPVYLKVRCSYPKDVGAWFICAASGGDMHWVWRSDHGRSDPPVSRSDPVKVDSRPLAVPLWLSVILCITFFILAVALPFLFLWATGCAQQSP